MPTVLVKCGDSDKILTPFPFIALQPDNPVFTAKAPLLDFRVYYNSSMAKLQ